MIVVYDDAWLVTVAHLGIAMEHGHRNSVGCSIENGGSFHSYVKLPEGNPSAQYHIVYR